MAGDTTLYCTAYQNFLMQVVTALQESEGNVLPFSDEVALLSHVIACTLRNCDHFGPRSTVEPLTLMI